MQKITEHWPRLCLWHALAEKQPKFAKCEMNCDVVIPSKTNTAKNKKYIEASTPKDLLGFIQAVMMFQAKDHYPYINQIMQTERNSALFTITGFMNKQLQQQQFKQKTKITTTTTTTTQPVIKATNNSFKDAQQRLISIVENLENQLQKLNRNNVHQGANQDIMVVKKALVNAHEANIQRFYVLIFQLWAKLLCGGRLPIDSTINGDNILHYAVKFCQQTEQFALTMGADGIRNALYQLLPEELQQLSQQKNSQNKTPLQCLQGKTSLCNYDLLLTQFEAMAKGLVATPDRSAAIDEFINQIINILKALKSGKKDLTNLGSFSSIDSEFILLPMMLMTVATAGVLLPIMLGMYVDFVRGFSKYQKTTASSWLTRVNEISQEKTSSFVRASEILAFLMKAIQDLGPHEAASRELFELFDPIKQQLFFLLFSHHSKQKQEILYKQKPEVLILQYLQTKDPQINLLASSLPVLHELRFATGAKQTANDNSNKHTLLGKLIEEHTSNTRQIYMHGLRISQGVVCITQLLEYYRYRPIAQQALFNYKNSAGETAFDLLDKKLKARIELKQSALNELHIWLVLISAGYDPKGFMHELLDSNFGSVTSGNFYDDARNYEKAKKYFLTLILQLPIRIRNKILKQKDNLGKTLLQSVAKKFGENGRLNFSQKLFDLWRFLILIGYDSDEKLEFNSNGCKHKGNLLSYLFANQGLVSNSIFSCLKTVFDRVYRQHDLNKLFAIVRDKNKIPDYWRTLILLGLDLQATYEKKNYFEYMVHVISQSDKIGYKSQGILNLLVKSSEQGLKLLMENLNKFHDDNKIHDLIFSPELDQFKNNKNVNLDDLRAALQNRRNELYDKVQSFGRLTPEACLFEVDKFIKSNFKLTSTEESVAEGAFINKLMCIMENKIDQYYTVTHKFNEVFAAFVIERAAKNGSYKDIQQLWKNINKTFRQIYLDKNNSTWGWRNFTHLYTTLANQPKILLKYWYAIINIQSSRVGAKFLTPNQQNYSEYVLHTLSSLILKKQIINDVNDQNNDNASNKISQETKLLPALQQHCLNIFKPDGFHLLKEKLVLQLKNPNKSQQRELLLKLAALNFAVALHSKDLEKEDIFSGNQHLTIAANQHKSCKLTVSYFNQFPQAFGEFHQAFKSLAFVFTQQSINFAVTWCNLVRKGLALNLKINTQDDFFSHISKLLSNPSFKNKSKLISYLEDMFEKGIIKNNKPLLTKTREYLKAYPEGSEKTNYQILKEIYKISAESQHLQQLWNLLDEIEKNNSNTSSFSQFFSGNSNNTSTSLKPKSLSDSESSSDSENMFEL